MDFFHVEVSHFVYCRHANGGKSQLTYVPHALVGVIDVEIEHYSLMTTYRKTNTRKTRYKEKN